MDFSLEHYEAITDEINDLYSKAVDETVINCPFKHDVDHSQFIALDNAELLQLVTARDEGKLVGFHASSILDDIFYKGKKTAFVLMYYLTKEYRGGGGYKMFKYADDLFAHKNVDRSFMSRKVHIDNESLFKRLGYTKIESNYEKYYD